MSAPSLLKRDWTKDHVYLVQFPRAGCIPTPSPFALKLETWLRCCDIPYTNVSNNFTTMSSKGQIPFVEDPDANLTPPEKAQFTAYRALIENHLFWCLVYARSRDNKWFGSEDKGFAGHLSGIKKTIFQNFLLERFRKKMFGAVNAQGTGRHNRLEVEKMAMEAFDSLENLIGTKPFFFGPNPTTFLFTPQLSNELKRHLEEKCPCLTKMVHRIKDEFWPDWQEAIEKLSLDTKWKHDAVW